MYLDGNQWYFIGVVLDIRLKATLVSRCFVGCLGQARKRCCCGLRKYPSDVRPTDPLAAGVESPSQTLALGVVFFTPIAVIAGLKYKIK